MKPVKTEYSNIIFVADGCGDLPATICQNLTLNRSEIETVWELSDEEIKQITESRRLYVYISGKSVPPMAICTEPQLIFADEKEVLNDD